MLRRGAVRVGADRRLGRGLRRLPVALADRARAGGSSRSQRLDPPAWGIGATLPSFAVSFVLALAVAVAHRRLRRAAGARMSTIASIGNLAVDRIAAAAARRRGVFYAARAAAHDRRGRGRGRRGARPPTAHAARAARGARRAGDVRRRDGDDGVQLPLRGRPPGDDGRRASATRGRRRTSTAGPRPRSAEGAVGARRRAPALALPRRDARGARARGTATAARRAGARARRPQVGPLAGTATSTATCSRHLAVLKLNEDEARDPRRGRSTPERCARSGSPRSCSRSARTGALVVTPTGRRASRRIRSPAVDPTGAGDAFSLVYLTAGRRGSSPSAPPSAPAETSRSVLGRRDDERCSSRPRSGRSRSTSTTDEVVDVGDGSSTPAPAPTVDLPLRRHGRRRTARRSWPSSTDGRRWSSRTTAGATWREAGGGLAPGVAVAISPDHPDLMVYATAERLYVSHDGGRFWRRSPSSCPGSRRSRSSE